MAAVDVRPPTACHATAVFGTRPRPTFGFRIARRGWALARAVVLIVFTGFLVAAVLATIFARARDRDQRQASVSRPGPVARAAELASLGHERT